MSKRNSATKANNLKLSKHSRAGIVHKLDGQMVTVYKQGYDAYFGGMTAFDAEKQGSQFFLGWRRALESDKKLHTQCSKPHVRASIEARIHKAYDLAA